MFYAVEYIGMIYSILEINSMPWYYYGNVAINLCHRIIMTYVKWMICN